MKDRQTMTDLRNAPIAPIPAPPDFPVTWRDPADERAFWTHDRMHWPDPLPLLFFDLLPEEGFNAAFAHYDVPMQSRGTRVNSYLYNAMAPIPLPPEEMQAKGKSAEEKIGAAMARLDELWATAWLPEIKRHQAFWDGFDRRGASNAALLTHLDETVDRLARLWELHFLIVLPSYLPVSQLDELYQEIFGKEGAFDAYRLIQGLDNKTVEAGRELWTLSRRALDVPSVKTLLETTAAAEVIPALERSSEGRAFLADLRAYVEAYGQRGQSFATLTDVSWIEDPTPAIKSLKDLVGQPGRDFDAERAGLAAEREQAIAAARERLQGYPQAVREQFEFLLRAASVGVALSEDHNFWIDYSSTYKARRVFLEVGRRLAEAGALDRATDFPHLTLDEIKVAAAALPAAIDHRAIVAERKAEMARWATVQAPPAIGTPPPGPPPDDAFGRFAAKFFGVPPPASTAPSELKGAPGSPGTVRGTARVIRSLADAVRLGKGEILVAETTAPPWTPLFATAAAVVTDTGGILSHCAVVAREYGIPAVVGTGRATTAIEDGQPVEVDGDAGLVRLL
jgi:phosphohistidine swiveling domain-containing protein